MCALWKSGCEFPKIHLIPEDIAIKNTIKHEDKLSKLAWLYVKMFLEKLIKSTLAFKT